MSIAVTNSHNAGGAVAIHVAPVLLNILIEGDCLVGVTLNSLIAIVREADICVPAKILSVEIDCMNTHIYTGAAVACLRIVVDCLHLLVRHKRLLHNHVFASALIDIDSCGNLILEETEVETEVEVGECLPLKVIITQVAQANTIDQRATGRE